MKIKINPDEAIVKSIRNRLKVTNGQCPCVPENEWNEDTICPCKKFREEKECCCGLYVQERLRGFEKISKEQTEKDNLFELNIVELENIKLPQRATAKSAGYDFFSPFAFRLLPNDEIKIPTGIKAYMQDDEQLDIRVRSSSGFKYNIRLKNQLGLIDADYYNNRNNEGHIWIALKNEGNKEWLVEQGEAIAQGTFHKYLTIDNDVPVSSERLGGIGSTNK